MPFTSRGGASRANAGMTPNVLIPENSSLRAPRERAKALPQASQETSGRSSDHAGAFPSAARQATASGEVELAAPHSGQRWGVARRSYPHTAHRPAPTRRRRIRHHAARSAGAISARAISIHHGTEE